MQFQHFPIGILGILEKIVLRKRFELFDSFARVAEITSIFLIATLAEWGIIRKLDFYEMDEHLVHSNLGVLVTSKIPRIYSNI